MNSYNFKYIIVGDSGVGKSSIVKQLIEKKIDQTCITACVDFASYIYYYDEDKIRMQIWDTAGQEVFRSLTRSYYRNADCAFLIFDLTNLQSFKNIKSWMNDVKKYEHNIKIILIGNKNDLKDLIVVTNEDVDKFINDYKLEYYELNAKDFDLVYNCFVNSAIYLYNNKSKKNNENYVKLIGNKVESGKSIFTVSSCACL